MGWAPRLSPDGTRAAIFVDEDAPTNLHRIGFVSIDDPDSLVLTGPEFDGGCWCEWSPDGEAFVVVHDNFRSILDPDGGPATTQPWIEDVAPGATWQRLAP